MMFVESTSFADFLDDCIKELKGRLVKVEMTFKAACYLYKWVADGIVAFLQSTAVVYRSETEFKTCRRKWKNQYSVFVRNGKVYFLSEANELVEWNVVSLKEKVLFKDVCLMCGVPGEHYFLSAHPNGILHTSQAIMDLKKDFPNLPSYNWCAMTCTEDYAVIALKSCSEALNTSYLYRTPHNLYLLVNLTNLEVSNKEMPLIEWRIGGTLAV